MKSLLSGTKVTVTRNISYKIDVVIDDWLTNLIKPSLHNPACLEYCIVKYCGLHFDGSDFKLYKNILEKESDNLLYGKSDGYGVVFNFSDICNKDFYITSNIPCGCSVKSKINIYSNERLETIYKISCDRKYPYNRIISNNLDINPTLFTTPSETMHIEYETINPCLMNFSMSTGYEPPSALFEEYFIKDCKHYFKKD